MIRRMWDPYAFSLISAAFLVMIEFPPNPEDGELFLPSDLYSEIGLPEDAGAVSPESIISTALHVPAPFDRAGFSLPKVTTPAHLGDVQVLCKHRLLLSPLSDQSIIREGYTLHDIFTRLFVGA